jgi:hypothetical protein
MRTQENFPVGHPSEIAPNQARLTWRFFQDRLPKKKMHLIDMNTLLILLRLEPGYPIPGARISHMSTVRVDTLTSSTQKLKLMGEGSQSTYTLQHSHSRVTREKGTNTAREKGANMEINGWKHK